MHSPGLSKEDRERLLQLAVDSIRAGLANGKPLSPELHALPQSLLARRATFVTLLKRGALRGCMGSLEAFRSLAEDIAANAFSAAFRDPRFPPITSRDMEHIDIHLSLLTIPVPLLVPDEESLLKALQPGQDGLILEDGPHRATFLPSVWETLPNKRIFLARLKEKAGLSASYWSAELRFFRYTAENIPEKTK